MTVEVVVLGIILIFVGFLLGQTLERRRTEQEGPFPYKGWCTECHYEIASGDPEVVKKLILAHYNQRHSQQTLF